MPKFENLNKRIVFVRGYICILLFSLRVVVVLGATFKKAQPKLFICINPSNPYTHTN